VTKMRMRARRRHRPSGLSRGADRALHDFRASGKRITLYITKINTLAHDAWVLLARLGSALRGLVYLCMHAPERRCRTPSIC
jgi:hypothetical protein